MTRPLTRLRMVLGAPLPGALASACSGAAESLAARVADALAVHGVQVRQQVHGALPDGAPRADVALWLPDNDGRNTAPDVRAAPARVHAALVVEPPADATASKALARFDALLVPLEGLREPVRQALRRTSSREVPIVAVRLPGAPLLPREAEKALRSVAGSRVVLVDVRDDRSSGGVAGDAEIERVIVQLALKSHEGAVVLLTSHEERARARVRSLCARHAVDAYLASGPDAFSQSIAASDLFMGRPSWDELLLAALHKVAVCVLPIDGKAALLDALRVPVAASSHGHARAALVDDVASVLSLAAALDRRLADPGSLDARGMSLREAVFGADAELIDALAGLEPLPHGATAAAAWELVGPHAVEAPREAGVVEAKDASSLASNSPSRAQQIEDALAALKHKMQGTS